MSDKEAGRVEKPSSARGAARGSRLYRLGRALSTGGLSLVFERTPQSRTGSADRSSARTVPR
jgi:hypothetical protein